jgi:hypothetical protein
MNRKDLIRQSLPVKVRKRLIRSAEAVRPDQPTIFLDAPAIGYMSADHLLAVCSTTQHKPLKGQQLRSRRQFDF